MSKNDLDGSDQTYVHAAAWNTAVTWLPANEVVTTAGVFLPGSPASWPLSSSGPTVEADDTEEDIDEADAVEEDALEEDYVDPYFTCFDRTPDKMWHPFARPEDRRMRDILWGPTEAGYHAEMDAAIEAELLVQKYSGQDRIVTTGDLFEPHVPLPFGKPWYAEDRIVTTADIYLPEEGPPFEKPWWTRDGIVTTGDAFLPDLLGPDSSTVQPPPVRRRPSRYIDRKTFYRIYEGIQFANYQGAVMNAELSVNWEMAGYSSPEDIDQAFEALTQRWRKYCAHRELPNFYYGVFENGKEYGYHSHLHLHVPQWTRKFFRRWLATALMLPDRSPMPSTMFEVRLHKDDHFIGQWQWFKYLMKGVDPKLNQSERDTHGQKTFNQVMGVFRQAGGQVCIKRVRYSRSMGPKAMALVGYRAPFIGDLLTPWDKYTWAEYVRGQSDRSPLNRIRCI